MSRTLDPGRLSRVRVRTPGKHIVAFALAALVMAGGAIFLVRLASRPSGPAPVAAATPAPAASAGVTALPEFLTDLAPDGAGRVAYLKLAAGLRAGPEASAALALHGDEIRERILFLLRGLSADDLKGADGLARLREEMLRRVNLVIAPARADELVIADMIVQ